MLPLGGPWRKAGLSSWCKALYEKQYHLRWVLERESLASGVGTRIVQLMENQTATPVEILLVEDSPSDAMMTQEALLHNNVLNPIHTVTDGTEALLYLRRQGIYSNALKPGLILLDINLPRKNGLEVLAEIKEDSALRTIPVIVLTTSKAQEDIVRAYALHANSYMSKPVEFSEFIEAMKALKDFWFSVVTLPAGIP